MELKKQQYDVTIPLSDRNMDLLTAHENEIKNHTKLATPSREIFLRAYDKQKTVEYCMANGIPCPKTKQESETMEDFLEEVTFPLAAKPRRSWGAIGFKIILTESELEKSIHSGKIDLDQYVLQEYIPQCGKQISVHLFMDDRQRLCAGAPAEKMHWYPVDGGASCLCRTIVNDEIVNSSEKLLKAMRWRSYCEMEWIIDPRDGITKLMEINGRASASIKIMHLAGISVAEQMMQLACGEPVSEQLDYTPDVYLRRFSTDFLWMIKTFHQQGGTVIRQHLDKVHETSFSVCDPMPALGSAIKLIAGIPAYTRELKKRQKR